MWLGQDESMQGAGCPGGCQGVDGRLYEWVQGVDGLGTTVGYWRPTIAQPPGAPYVRNNAPFLGEIVYDTLLPHGRDLALEANDAVHPPEQQRNALGQHHLQVAYRSQTLKRTVQVSLPRVERLDLGQDWQR